MLGHDIQGTLCKHQCPPITYAYSMSTMELCTFYWNNDDDDDDTGCSLHKENTCSVLVNKFLENILKLPPSEYVQESHVYIRL